MSARKPSPKPVANWSQQVSDWLRQRGLQNAQQAQGVSYSEQASRAVSELCGRFLAPEPGATPFGVASYPSIPGHRARATSRAAAAAVQPRQKALQARVLDCLSREQLTADECARQLGESILSIRPRCSELARLGAVADSGLRRRNASGKSAIVWRVL